MTTSKFVSDTGSSILANQSTVYVEGDVIFANNSAHIGGALHLACNPLSGEASGLSLFPNSNVVIANNSASFGGGISANEECINGHWCFFQFAIWTESNTSNITDHVKVTMQNNSATIAGDSLYGGPIDDCYLLTDDIHSPVMVDVDIFLAIFNLSGKPYISRVASAPYRICFCINRSPDDHCMTTSSLSAFRSEEIHVLAIVSGKTRGAYSATVRTTTGSSVELGPLQDVQRLVRSCGNLTYSVRSSANYAELYLSVDNNNLLGDPPSVINVTLMPCPFGFQELGDPPTCDCLLRLSMLAGVTCDINTQMIHRPGNVWIGNYSGDLVSHSNCPFDYCKDENSISPQ